MEELKYMSSESNSLKGVKEKYKRGIIDNFQWLRDNTDIIKQEAYNMGVFGKEGYKLVMQRYFNKKQYRECADNSMGSNDRWGIVGKKNLFGLEARIAPDEVYKQGEEITRDKKWFLKANAGRFQPQKFSLHLFPNFINISDILERKTSEQFSEFERFYDMTNKEVFEVFGVLAEDNNEKMLVANSVLLDSLLRDKYLDINSIWCGRLTNAYCIKIEMNDGTKIIAGSPDNEKGIIIRRNEKEAMVEYETLNKSNSSELKDINDLDVSGVTYSGDDELIIELKKAMEEQFESQRDEKGISNNDILELLFENGRDGITLQAEKIINDSLHESIQLKGEEK